VLGFGLGLGLGLGLIANAFITRMAALQAKLMRETQWHPRVCKLLSENELCADDEEKRVGPQIGC
jgi:hypothetical protein